MRNLQSQAGRIHQINPLRLPAMDLSHDAEALDPDSTFLPGLRGTGSGVGLSLCPAVS